EDRNNLKPCSPEDIETYGADGNKLLATDLPSLDDGAGGSGDDLLEEMLGDGKEETKDDLLEEFLEEDGAKGTPAEKNADEGKEEADPTGDEDLEAGFD